MGEREQCKSWFDMTCPERRFRVCAVLKPAITLADVVKCGQRAEAPNLTFVEFL
jgi:hypothetical protein